MLTNTAATRYASPPAGKHLNKESKPPNLRRHGLESLRKLVTVVFGSDLFLQMDVARHTCVGPEKTVLVHRVLA